MDPDVLASELPGQGAIDALVVRYLQKYKVYRGTGGVTVLIDEAGYVRTAATSRIVESLQGVLPDRLERAAFWRQLRAHPEVRELVETTVQRAHANTYAEVRHDAEIPGWYYCALGRQPEFISPYAGFAFVDLGMVMAQGVDMAINSKPAIPKVFHGYLGEPGMVLSPVRGYHNLMVVVLCPLGVTREFRAVIETREGSLRVVMLRVRREGPYTTYENIPAPDRLPYIIARDAKGRARVFIRP